MAMINSPGPVEDADRYTLMGISKSSAAAVTVRFSTMISVLRSAVAKVEVTLIYLFANIPQSWEVLRHWRKGMVMKPFRDLRVQIGKRKEVFRFARYGVHGRVL